jgi:4-amino-4-deoxy-L-arabinose transferase-like glycosyltransferase
MRRLWLDFGWVLLWALGLAIALWIRPLLPSDETRYVSAAWEMWTRGDFLVPHLNGETYSHKPPLMFWSMHAGWWIFGVNDWWPRLVSPIAGLAALFAARSLALDLWPDRPEVARLVPWLLIGSLFWALFGTVTMFDMWNALFATTGLVGIVRAATGRMASGFIILGVSIGLGVLAKGPVILLYTLPPALLVPWWLNTQSPVRLATWYAGLVGSIGLGAAIALCWALPAAASGGDAYTQAIFWGQTAGRVEKSFAHGRPFWWYVPLLPLLLFPWVFWPRLWRGGFQIPSRQDWQVRVAIAWLLPAFVAFSFISGKQPHYLLPLFPALALMAAVRLSRRSTPGPWDQRFPAGITFVAGIILAVLPMTVVIFPDLWSGVRLPYWLFEVSPFGGVGLMVLSGLMLRWRRDENDQIAWKMALIAPVTVGLVHLFVFSAAIPAYDLKAVSTLIKGLQSEGRAVAWRQKYHSQFHFLGRLRQPVLVVKNQPLPDWFSEHPNGVMIMTHKMRPPANLKPVFWQPYRGGYLAVWDRQAIETGNSLFE